MNQPIGIPSGWEEIAAWNLANNDPWDVARYTSNQITRNKVVKPIWWNEPHDWRVEE